MEGALAGLGGERLPKIPKAKHDHIQPFPSPNFQSARQLSDTAEDFSVSLKSAIAGWLPTNLLLCNLECPGPRLAYPASRIAGRTSRAL